MKDVKKRPKMNVLGVCGGQGPMLFPYLGNKHFKVVGNLEPRAIFHTPKEEQWKINFGQNIPFFKDMFDQEMGIGDVRVDIIVGSPSCGASSKFGRTGRKDGELYGKPGEDKSLQMYLNRVRKYKPKFFLLENLPKMLELFKIEDLSNAIDNQYMLIPHAGSVCLWGNSQKNRVRMVLVGVRLDCKDALSAFKEVFPVNTLKNCKLILKEADKEINYYEPLDYKLSLYDRDDEKKPNLTVQQVHDLYRGKFKDEYFWPTYIEKMRYIPGVYRNAKFKGPATIRPANRQFSHTGWPIGLDEFRIIMGFPKEFKVHIDKSNPKVFLYWLNKGRVTFAKGAVYEMGLWFYQCIKKAKKLL
jgi:site-specific DNA-cytosine methylase